MNEPARELGPSSRKTVGCFLPGLLLAPCLVLGCLSVLPSLQPGRKHGGETTAIGTLKTIATAESIFREGDSDGDGVRDYGTLTELAQAHLVDAVLGSGTKQGYLFRVSCGASSGQLLWFATANPAVPTTTGDRYFCTNQDGVIFYTTIGSFALNTTDIAIPASALPIGR